MSSPLRVIREDGDILAVDKPAGQAVIPGRGLSKEPLCLQAQRHTGGKIFIAHRIDREASGLVIFAKNPQIHRRLCQDFESRRARKTYWVALQGSPAQEGSIDKPLRLFGSGRMGVADSKGQPSLTRYKTIERFPNAALVEARPLTGRRHQLRVHFFSLGTPILGDPLYGRPPRPVGGFPRLMLHALELRIPEADHGAPLVLRAEPDEEFLRLFALLRAEDPKLTRCAMTEGGSAA
ncbi:MAG: RluA family pseudouridine synthase [Elusimicrobia bacterium]|nr:RluA family pseudouridine synthase [Elusimicrobiota bacterium]MDE2314584.1 RluA family pseudouridine synthase [Elusimicrobiota bacterium]